jgi:hypothetical protein
MSPRLKPQVRKTTLVVFHRQPHREGHDCEGEAIVIRVASPSLGWVVHADRCAKDPATGCDGVPLFTVGDVVRSDDRGMLWETGGLDLLGLKSVPGAKQ